MNFRKATQEDMAYVRLNPFEDAVKDYPYMEVPDDNTYCVIYDSAIVAVGGAQVRREGVGLFWLILTAECKKSGIHGLRALYAIKEKVDELMKKNNFHRAEAHIRPDFSIAIAMIESLGFKREGLMRQCNPDKTDAYLYARII